MLDFVRDRQTLYGRGWLLLVAPPPWGGLGGGLAFRQELGGTQAPPLHSSQLNHPLVANLFFRLDFVRDRQTLYGRGWLLLVAPPPWGGLGGGLAFRQELGGTQAPPCTLPSLIIH